MQRRRNTLWAALIVAAVLVASGVALWKTSDLGRAASEVEAQRAAARREGLALDYADYRRLIPPVAYDSNAAVPYRRAFETIQRAGVLKGLKSDDLIKQILKAVPAPEKVLEAHVRVA